MTSGSGTCAVTFDQAGDASYLAAPQKTQTTAAREAAQSIAVTTSARSTAAFGASFPVAATSSSGLSVAIPATVTMTAHTDACTVHFNQAGNADFSAAPPNVQVTTAQ